VHQEETIKKKESFIQRFVMDVYTVVKEVDKKNWVQEMQALFKKYVESKNLNIKQSDPKGAPLSLGTEEMNRQIGHLEESIQEIFTNSQKRLYR